MHSVLVVLAIGTVGAAVAAQASNPSASNPASNPAGNPAGNPPASRPSPSSPSKSAPVLVDSVVATVNDSPILLSELRTLMIGELRNVEQTEGKVTSLQRQRIERDNLKKLVDKRRMAQAAKTFGDIPPEQVEQWLRSEIDREKKTQLREFGTFPAFGRELARQGRSWVTYEEDLRIEKMWQLAEDIAVYSRLQRQTNLLVTPRMLREAYAAWRDQFFVHAATARVTQVGFSGPNAQQQAAAAAAEWRQKDIPVRELAAKYEGARAIPPLSVASLAPEFAAVAEFGIAGPKGNVSGPIAVGDRFHVVRIIEFEPARAGRFEDPDVQARLRDQCVRVIQREFMAQALQRASMRTTVWQSELPRQSVASGGTGGSAPAGGR